MSERRLLTIYDGQCSLCVRARQLATLLDWRDRLSFADLHDQPTIQALAPGLSQEETLATLHLRLGDGRFLRGFAAIRRLLVALPLLAPLAWLLYLPPLAQLGRVFYQLVARNRSCTLPQPAAR